MKAFIRGREIFGTAIMGPPPGYRSLIDYLFDSKQLTDGAPPNDRGCRFCGKIGHIQKDCPKKRVNLEKRDKKEKVKDRKDGRDGRRSICEGSDPGTSRTGPLRDNRDTRQQQPSSITATTTTTTSSSSHSSPEGKLKFVVPLNVMEEHRRQWEGDYQYQALGNTLLGLTRIVHHPSSTSTTILPPAQASQDRDEETACEILDNDLSRSKKVSNETSSNLSSHKQLDSEASGGDNYMHESVNSTLSADDMSMDVLIEDLSDSLYVHDVGKVRVDENVRYDCKAVVDDSILVGDESRCVQVLCEELCSARSALKQPGKDCGHDIWYVDLDMAAESSLMGDSAALGLNHDFYKLILNQIDNRLHLDTLTSAFTHCLERQWTMYDLNLYDSRTLESINDAKIFANANLPEDTIVILHQKLFEVTEDLRQKKKEKRRLKYGKKPGEGLGKKSMSPKTLTGSIKNARLNATPPKNAGTVYMADYKNSGHSATPPKNVAVSLDDKSKNSYPSTPLCNIQVTRMKQVINPNTGAINKVSAASYPQSSSDPNTPSPNKQLGHLKNKKNPKNNANTSNLETEQGQQNKAYGMTVKTRVFQNTEGARSSPSVMKQKFVARGPEKEMVTISPDKSACVQPVSDSTRPASESGIWDFVNDRIKYELGSNKTVPNPVTSSSRRESKGKNISRLVVDLSRHEGKDNMSVTCDLPTRLPGNKKALTVSSKEKVSKHPKSKKGAAERDE